MRLAIRCAALDPEEIAGAAVLAAGAGGLMTGETLQIDRGVTIVGGF